MALYAVWVSGAAMWFLWFWPGFRFWRRHPVLTYSLLGSYCALVGLFVYRSGEVLLGSTVAVPGWVRAVGWALIAAAAVLAVAADRQIGLRVRSFVPFFERSGRIELRTTGAYGIVRHPIYAAGIGFELGVFLLSGALAVLIAAAVLALAASWFTRQEERRLLQLLDDPEAYERYRARVPALFPRLR